jgi:carboxyl-terminal processing protease
MRSLLVGAIAGVGLALVFCAGFFIRDVVNVPSVFAAQTSDPDDGYPLLEEVQGLLDQHYLRGQPSPIERQYAAIRGVLGSLNDRNTFFIEPPVAQSESDVLAGTYGGIGVTIQRNGAGNFVLFPFLDSPSAQAGIQDNDILIKINGVELSLSESQDAIDQMLRGDVKEGNGVEITVLRQAEELTAFIEFQVINIPSVQSRALVEDERIGYIQIFRFTSRTPDEIFSAIENLSADNIQGLILDLRNNSGGLLQESIDVASVFLDGGIVLYERTKSDERVFEATSVGEVTDLPLVVIVNSGTASAAELVAGAIQDRERGILIGQTTYGKGTIQQIFSLTDGSSIHITSAEWLTPNMNALDGAGLNPDISMIPDENGRDVEIGEALRYLNDLLAESSAT